MDFTLYKAINGFAYGHDRFEDVLRFFALDAQFFFVALLAVLFLARGQVDVAKRPPRRDRRRPGRPPLALAIAHGIATRVASPAAVRRPSGDVHLFIAPSADSSFPSDHATAAFAIAVSLVLRSRQCRLARPGAHGRDVRGARGRRDPLSL